MLDLSPMNELSTELQEKAGNFITEVYKFTTPFGKFYASLTNGNHYDNWIEVCFTGYEVVECFKFPIEVLEHGENISKLARYCVRDVLNKAILRSLKHSDDETSEENS